MPYVDRMQKVQSKQINAVKKGSRNIQRVNHNLNIKKDSTCIPCKLYHHWHRIFLLTQENRRRRIERKGLNGKGILCRQCQVC